MSKSIFRPRTRFEQESEDREKERMGEAKQIAKGLPPQVFTENEFERAKCMKEGFDFYEKWEERKRTRLGNRKVDWDSTEEVNLRAQDIRRNDRMNLLDRLVPDRVCPTCQRKLCSNRGWVVKDGFAECKSCAWTKSQSEGVTSSRAVIIDIVRGTKIRYVINSLGLLRLRIKVELGQKQFAHLVGWSNSYQNHLESSQTQSVSQETLDKLIKVFTSRGVKVRAVREAMISREKISCLIEGWALGAVRHKLGIGLSALSLQLGFTYQKLYRVETQVTECLTYKDTKKILDYFESLSTSERPVIIKPII